MVEPRSGKPDAFAGIADRSDEVVAAGEVVVASPVAVHGVEQPERSNA